MWNIDCFVKTSEDLKEKLPNVKILYGGPEIATEYVQNSHFDKYSIDYCVSKLNR